MTMFPMRRELSCRAAVTNSVLPRRWALSMAAAVFALATAGGALADDAKVNLAQAVKKTVLVFPFDMPADGPPNKDEVSQLLTDTVVSRLLASGQYTVVQYHKTLPPVARLRLDQQLTDSDVAPPFADDTAKATKIAKAVGYDVAFTGAIDEYTYNEGDNQADVVARGQLLDIKTGKAIGAPVILKGSSDKGGTSKQPVKAMDAARSAGSQIAQKLVPITSTPAPQPTNPITKSPAREPQKKKRNNNGLLFGLLAIGLGLGIGLASSGGGHGNSSGGDTPPSPP